MRSVALCGLALGLLLSSSGCAGGHATEVAGGQGGAVGSAPSGGRSASVAGAAGRALSTVRVAARNTLASSVGVEFELRGARALGSSSAPVLGSGEFDFPAGTGTEAIDLGEIGRQEPGNEHVIFMPTRVYLQPKARSTTVLPKGKQWVSATLTGSDSVSTNFPSFALQVEAVNPQLLLAEIAGGAVAASPSTGASIGGEQARGYDVTVDLARSLGTYRGPTAPVLGAAIQSELAALASGGPAQGQHTSIRAWVDSAGRVTRLQSSPPGAEIGTASMTICCFGVPVEVTHPPAGRVVDITSLTPSGERENNGGGDSDGG